MDDVILGGILASSPSDFASSGDIVCRDQRGTLIDPLYVFGGHLRIQIRLFTSPSNLTFGLLDCHPKDNAQTVVGIPLHGAASDGSSDEYIRPEGRLTELLRDANTDSPSRLIRIRKERQSPTDHSTNRRYGFYVEESADETGLEILEVEPRVRWEKDNATINTTVDFDGNETQLTWVRFRRKTKHCPDFVHEDREIGPQRTFLERKIRKQSTNLEGIKQNLAGVQGQLDRLELEKQTLKRRIEETSKALILLEERDEVLKLRRSGVCHAVAASQDAMGSLEQESAEQWYEAIVQSLLGSISPEGSTVTDLTPVAGVSEKE